MSLFHHLKLTVTLFGLCLASVAIADLQRFEHPTKADGSLSVMVIGDWGRRGTHNQSEVALQMGKTAEKLDTDFIISTGNIKLNADGCVKESLGKAGFGGLFRDAKSSWILGYSGKLDVATSLEAEIWAIYRGTTIINEKGWRNVIIETDCQDAVNLINGRAHPNCPYRALVEDIKFLTSRMDCIIKHIFREANQCADALAHMGENQVEDLKIYEDPPILLRPILVADMVGIVFERD